MAQPLVSQAVDFRVSPWHFRPMQAGAPGSAAATSLKFAHDPDNRQIGQSHMRLNRKSASLAVRRVPRMGWVWVVAVASALHSGVPAASAGGFTYQAPSAVPMGRGGAFYARGDNAMAAFFAPALLSESDRFEINAGTNLAFYELCVQRSGTYRSGTQDSEGMDLYPDDPNQFNDRYGRFGDYADEAFPEACSNSPIGVVPYLMGSIRLLDRLGLGVGILPPLGSPEDRWGHSVLNRDGQERPNPLRYSYVGRRSTLIRGVLSVGGLVTPWLRLGGGFVYGATIVKSQINQAPRAGELPVFDVLSEVDATDPFIPGFIVSAHAQPHPNLDIAVWFHWLDSSRARGTLALTSGINGTGEDGSLVRQPEVVIDDAVLITPQPMELRLAFRWADRRASRDFEYQPRSTRDPLRDERWDIELVLGYERTSHIDAFTNRIGPGNTIDFEAVGSPPNPLPVREETVIPKGYRDQFSVLLGSDVTVLPERLALRAGLSFETRGIDPSLVQPDFIAGMRLGLHAGFTVRLGPIDIHAAYMHVFQETIDVPTETAAFTQPVSIGTGAVVNAGTYRANLNVVSLELQARY